MAVTFPSRPPIRISVVYRLWCTWLGFFGLYVGWGLRSHPELYQIPIFEAVLTLAALETWAYGWMLAGTLCLIAGIVNDVRFWRAGGSLSAALAAAWFAGITWEWQIDNQPISPTGWVLWASLVVSQILAMFGNRQLSSSSPLFDRLTDDYVSEKLAEDVGARGR